MCCCALCIFSFVWILRSGASLLVRNYTFLTLNLKSNLRVFELLSMCSARKSAENSIWQYHPEKICNASAIIKVRRRSPTNFFQTSWPRTFICRACGFHFYEKSRVIDSWVEVYAWALVSLSWRLVLRPGRRASCSRPGGDHRKKWTLG